MREVPEPTVGNPAVFLATTLRVGQNEAAQLQAVLAAVACSDCGAQPGQPCTRPAVDGRRYETRLLLHQRRHDAAKAARGGADG